MLISSITQRTKITPYSFNVLFKRYLSSESIITAEDPIHKIDLRVGKIIDINNHPEATHLYIEKVDLSTEQTDSRTIVSGLVPYMSKESLQVIRFLYITKLETNRSCIKQDRNVIVVSNLKASRFRGVLSQGMLLAASLENKVETLSPPSTATLGERVQLEGIALGEAVDVLKPKQKILEQVVQYLKTNQNGIATYKGIPLVTSQGPVSCDIKQGQIS